MFCRDSIGMMSLCLGVVFVGVGYFLPGRVYGLVGGRPGCSMVYDEADMYVVGQRATERRSVTAYSSTRQGGASPCHKLSRIDLGHFGFDCLPDV